MASENNKNAIWALLLSLLALITTFRQNYHNYQLVVTPNEMVGFYCRDYPLNDPRHFFLVCPSTSKVLLPSENSYMVLGSS